MTVAESIRYLMDQRGWTVADLTRASGVARSTIDNMFSRGTGITNSTLEAIAEAFGLTAVQVLSMGNAMVELTPEQSANMTYGDVAERAKSIDYSFVNPLMAQWTDQWNRTINN